MATVTVPVAMTAWGLLYLPMPVNELPGKLVYIAALCQCM